MEFQNKDHGVEFFRKFYKLPELDICNEAGTKLFTRKMRAYLIKDEGTFERLALDKY